MPPIVQGPHTPHIPLFLRMCRPYLLSPRIPPCDVRAILSPLPLCVVSLSYLFAPLLCASLPSPFFLTFSPLVCHRCLRRVFTRTPHRRRRPGREASEESFIYRHLRSLQTEPPQSSETSLILEQKGARFTHSETFIVYKSSGL